MPRTRIPRTREDVEARLRQLMSDEYGVRGDDITSEAVISQLAQDSVDSLGLTMAIEDEFDLEIPDSDVDKLWTFDDVASYLTAQLGLE